MIAVTDKEISPEEIIAKVKSTSSGCVVNYVGLIRDNSYNKPVLWVEYQDAHHTAESTLQVIASEVRQRWQVNDIAIIHRTGRLMVGEINLVVAVATAHRGEGFAAVQYIIDRFKEKLPTSKTEMYQDGSIKEG